VGAWHIHSQKCWCSLGAHLIERGTARRVGRKCTTCGGLMHSQSRDPQTLGGIFRKNRINKKFKNKNKSKLKKFKHLKTNQN